MANNVKISLQENDRVVMERRPGGSYALRLFRNGSDQGLLTTPAENANEAPRPILVSRDTALEIDGSGKNATLQIPANIDFSPRIIVNTDEKPLVSGGAFTLAGSSRQSVRVDAVERFGRNARLGMGGADDDTRFTDTTRVLRFSETASRDRSIGVEENAPAIELVDRQGRVLFSFSGKDTMQQMANTLGVTLAPAANPALAPAPRPVMGDAPAAPSGPAPTGPLNNNAKVVAGSIGTQMKNMAGMFASAPQSVKDSYERINRAAERLRGNSPTHEDVQAFRTALTAERETLTRLAQSDPAARSSANMLDGILENTTRNVDRIAGKQANPDMPAPPQRPGPAQAGQDALRANQQQGQLQGMATAIASRAEGYAQTSGGDQRIENLMRPLAQAARAAERDGSPENRQKMTEALNSAIEGMKRIQSSPRATMQLQGLQNLQEQLNGATQGRPTGMNGTGMSNDVMLAAAGALDGNLGRQQPAAADYNNITGNTALPGTPGGSAFRS